MTRQHVVPWLAQAPTGWEIKPLYSLGSEVKTLNRGLVESNLLSLSYGEIKRKDIEANFGLLPESFETYQIVEPGDMVFRFTDLQNDQKSLRSGLVKERGIITNAYLGFRPKSIDSKYFNYLMRAYDILGVFYSMGSGLRQSLNYSDVRRLPVPLPPDHEQRRIADFLDRETAKIDALIAKQEQLITTLDERRQAVISKAVSKGLNPDAPMTADSVNVLGHAPQHWTVKRLKYSIATSKNGVWGEEPRDDETDIWCARIADFDRPTRSVKQFPRTIRSVTMSERFGRTLARGDLIIEKSGGGDQAPVGCVVMYDYDEPAVCSNFAARLTMSNRNSSKYWTYAHAALYFQGVPWRSIKQTSGIQNLDLSSYLNEVVAFPPLAEQLEIAAYLDGATRDIDLLVEKSVATSSVLRERRAALISAAVTGKLEVTDGYS